MLCTHVSFSTSQIILFSRECPPLDSESLCSFVLFFDKPVKMAERAFTPIIVGDFTVPHRIVLAPLTRFRANEEQVPKEFVADYYGQRATCKGLLITEATSIHEDAARFEGSPGIYSEDQVKAWRKITDR